MRLNYLANAIGLVLTYIGAVMFFPIIVAIIYKDYSSILPFLYAIIISSGIGFALRKIVPNASRPDGLNDIKKGEALFVVAASWIIFGIIGAIPYLNYGLTPIDALFETVSGITTTGATILTGYDYPKTFFFWRSFTQWLGGLGIIVLFIAILPQFAVAGRQMFFAEAPGPTEDKFTPRIRNTASALWKVYIGLTLLCIILLKWAGMPVFDAVCNSLSTLSAGGFSPNPDSIMGYNSTLIIWIVIFFMFFSGASFPLQYKVITQRKPSLLFKSEEFRLYTLMVIVMSALIGISLYLHNTDTFKSITDSLYQVISIATTTGSVSTDYTKWDFTSKILLFLVAFMGSCASSAGGGIKMSRWLLIFKSMKSALMKILHPNAVINIKLDNTTVSNEILNQIAVFVFFYFFIFGVSAVLIAIIEQNSVVGLSTAISALGNIGPAFGPETGPFGSYTNLHIISKCIYIVNMIVGRLELIPFLVLFQADFWTIDRKAVIIKK
ncbi:TrkH family potassium uptake protein [bacterium]|nr:TrkH family potassium uptake protein [bacterium]